MLPWRWQTPFPSYSPICPPSSTPLSVLPTVQHSAPPWLPAGGFQLCLAQEQQRWECRLRVKDRWWHFFPKLEHVGGFPLWFQLIPGMPSVLSVARQCQSQSLGLDYRESAVSYKHPSFPLPFNSVFHSSPSPLSLLRGPQPRALSPTSPHPPVTPPPGCSTLLL